MYGYQEYIEITPEQILQKITQQEIFEFVLQEPFEFSSRYCSPCRDDKKPGCRFEEREDGTIIFVDFGELASTGRTHRTCFGMVMDKFKVNLQGAIELVMQEFKLSNDLTQYEVVNRVVYEKKIQRSDKKITFLSQPYTKANKIYWSQFLIRPQELIEDNVYATKKFFIEESGGVKKTIHTYKHGYAMDFIDAVKIYQPYSEKYKFITNCTENHIGNIDNLPQTGKELIIQKSYKDHRIVRNVIKNSNVIWFANEGCVPDMSILVSLVERFEVITIFFDNDEAGILAATKLVAIFNAIRPNCCKMVYLPTINIYKDLGEFICKEGRIDTIKVLKQIGIYGENA